MLISEYNIPNAHFLTNKINMSKKAPNEPLPLLDDFLLSLQSNNYSPETVYNYERDLKVFENFLKIG